MVAFRAPLAEKFNVRAADKNISTVLGHGSTSQESVDCARHRHQSVNSDHPCELASEAFDKRTMQDLEKVEAQVLARISEITGIPKGEIPLDQPFADLGLSSQELVVLSGDLEAIFGRPLSPTLAWEYPTIQSLVIMLSAPESDRDLGGHDG